MHLIKGMMWNNLVTPHDLCIKMHVQFKAGWTEASLAVSVSRDHWDRVPTAPLFCVLPCSLPVGCQDCFKERKVVGKIIFMSTNPGMHSWEERIPDNYFNVNKGKYTYLGGMDSLGSLLSATIDTMERWLLGEPHPASV